LEACKFYYIIEYSHLTYHYWVSDAICQLLISKNTALLRTVAKERKITENKANYCPIESTTHLD